MQRESQRKGAGLSHPRRVRRGIQRRQQLDAAQQDADRSSAGTRHKLPPPSRFAGAEHAERRKRHCVPPHALWKSEQQFRPEDRGYCRERERARPPPLVHDQHVGGGQQPRHVRDDGHHVDVMVVQQVEAAEREQHGAEERRRAAESQAAEEPEGSGEGRRVIGDQLEIECRPERKETVQQLMERMEQADLPFAVQIQSGEDRGCPQHGVARLQRLLIEVPRWQVEPRKVTLDEYAAGEQRTEEWRQQGDAAHSDERVEPTVAGRRRFDHRAGFRKARISSPRRIYRVASCL